jgi:hypothetical protein
MLASRVVPYSPKSVISIHAERGIGPPRGSGLLESTQGTPAPTSFHLHGREDARTWIPITYLMIFCMYGTCAISQRNCTSWSGYQTMDSVLQNIENR